MCVTCGCDLPTPTRTVRIEGSLLSKNARLAERNRAWIGERGLWVLNLIGSPGAGKTALLEATLQRRGGVAVLEGDQATARDAERIARHGAPVLQINTGNGCHLDADMVLEGLRRLDRPADELVIVENVGNLVCPALFDLGEQAKVVVLSVTEGDDKPLKYPNVFQAAELVVLSKLDLLPHTDFDVDRFLGNVRSLGSDADVICLSSRTGVGMDAWLRWLGPLPARPAVELEATA
jgi:hydrogenase nickel incorporation protein HypB